MSRLHGSGQDVSVCVEGGGSCEAGTANRPA